MKRFIVAITLGYPPDTFLHFGNIRLVVECIRCGIEAEGKHLTIESRLQLRAEKKPTTLNALHDWLTQTRSQTANGGGSAKALERGVIC
ncbi:hypothetical protein [Nitrosomonas sp. Is37]|uniref:hypothetical protein n=1 Tax=Nitrosomonas sp. Is37 TaxID=3080535 RepID=UPI00294AD0F6|nr:hypothetical protein [Nitrosomonas sp. Is37]MDV6344925.1 hypothetical protein [Nitrosomonas sp. Is37]